MTISDFLITPFGGAVENAEFSLSNLYMHLNFNNPGQNETQLHGNDATTGFGRTLAIKWAIYHGIGPNAELIALAQGLETFAGEWYKSFTISFQNARFKGWTLQVMGLQNNLAIVGGTGEFSMARGVINKTLHSSEDNRMIFKLSIRGCCCMKQNLGLPAPTKIGPWGGNGGTTRDIVEKPWRLESITIRAEGVIDSFAFKYSDQNGFKRTIGPWGAGGGNGITHTIKLEPSEFLKEVSGTYANLFGTTVVTSLKFVTSVRTYGPFGEPRFGGSAGTAFGADLPKDNCVVGFYGTSDRFLNSIGLYAVNLA